MKKKSFFSILTVMLISIATVSFYGCDKDKGGDDNGGGNGGEKTDPSSIAGENLIAYFPFDNNGVDARGLNPKETGSGVKYVTGRRGQAFQGGANSYFLYDLPENNKLRSLEEFTFAGWFKFVYNPIDSNDPEGMIFQIDGVTNWIWGNMAFIQQRRPTIGETLVGSAPMKTFFWKEDAQDLQNQFAENVFINQENRWVHFTATYNKTTSKFNVYVNGIAYTNEEGKPYADIDRYQVAPVLDDDGAVVTPGTPLGALKFNEATRLVIGDWMENVINPEFSEVWAAPFTGQIDELRFWDKALSDQEVKALYDAEVENID